MVRIRRRDAMVLSSLVILLAAAPVFADHPWEGDNKRGPSDPLEEWPWVDGPGKRGPANPLEEFPWVEDPPRGRPVS